MPRPLSLPVVAYLRCAPLLPVREVYEALRITRGRAYKLRSAHAFPSAVGGMINTQRLAVWLSHPSRRVLVEWV